MDPESQLLKDQDNQPGNSTNKCFGINPFRFLQSKDSDWKLPFKFFKPKEEPHKIFKIHLILSKICQHLNFEDLKNFRMVCKDWKISSELCFRNQARVTFTSHRSKCTEFQYLNETKLVLDKNFKSISDGGCKRNIRKVPPHLDDFFKILMSDCEVPFTAIGFIGIIPWHVDLLIEFFHKGLGRFIGDVRFYDPTFLDEFGNTLMEDFEINPILPDNIAILFIRNENDSKVNLSVDRLSSLQSLNLYHCNLTLCDGFKISVQELQLFNVAINNQTGRILINDYVDFSKMKLLSLVGDEYILDVSKDPHLSSSKMESNHCKANWKNWTGKLYQWAYLK